MTISVDAYNTIALRGHIIKPVVQALEKLAVTTNSDLKIQVVNNDYGYYAEVKPFMHPVVMEMSGKKEVFIDIRAFGKYDRLKEEFSVAMINDYNLMMARGNLNYVWAARGVETLRDYSGIPMSIFVSWVSEAITRRFILDMNEQYNVSALVAYYYASLFTNDEEFSERDCTRIATAMNKNAYTNTDDAFNIIDNLDKKPIHSLDALCDLIKEISPARLEHFNRGILLTLLNKATFGVNAEENLCVALEHPPTWIAILVIISDNRGFNRTGLGRILERKKAPDVREFLHATATICKN